MSDVARLWSRNIRGLNFAEHAVCRELAEYHVDGTDLCYPNMGTILDIYECSRPYLKKILARLDCWQLITRIEWYDPQERNRQTSNRYRLNLRRHFPEPPPEGRRTGRDKNKTQTPRQYDNRDRAALDGARTGKRFLKVLANIPHGNTRLISDGLKEAFFDAAHKTTFVTVDADGYLRELLPLIPDFCKYIHHETAIDTTLTLVPLYYRLKKR